MRRTNAVSSDAMEVVLRLLTPENSIACRISLATGLRISDVLNLKTRHLGMTSFVLYEAKTGKRRRVTIPVNLRAAAMSYSGKVYVFPHRYDEMRHRTRQAVWRDINRAAKALRLPGCVAPHSMRKTFARRKYAACGDMRAVQRLLNHSSEAVTALYVLADEVHCRSSMDGLSRVKSGKRTEPAREH